MLFSANGTFGFYSYRGIMYGTHDGITFFYFVIKKMFIHCYVWVRKP